MSEVDDTLEIRRKMQRRFRMVIRDVARGRILLELARVSVPIPLQPEPGCVVCYAFNADSFACFHIEIFATEEVPA